MMTSDPWRMSDDSWTHPPYPYGCEAIPLADHMAAYPMPLTVALEEKEAGCSLCVSLRSLTKLLCGPSAHDQLLTKLK